MIIGFNTKALRIAYNTFFMPIIICAIVSVVSETCEIE